MSYPVSNAFWSASSSWYSNRVDFEAANTAAGGRIPNPIAKKEAMWKARGAAYLRGRPDLIQRFKANETTFMVRVDPALSRALADIVDEINPAIVAAMDRHVGKLATDAFEAWPTSSGLSKSLIGLEYNVNGDEFTAHVTNTAPYVFFIKGSPHRKLLDGPSGVVALRVVADIQASVTQLAAK